jgi:hypothetical protein
MAESEPSPSPNPDRITFNYLKGTQFRVVHVDGAIGSITPQGLIHAAIYSERPAIPQMVVQPLKDGELGDPIEVVSRPGIVREVEVSLMLDLKVATALQEWLGTKIGELRGLIASQQPAAN